MADKSAIEWTDATWNPVTGCTKVTRGCDNCYAERIAERFRGVKGHPFENGFELTLRPERLSQPLSWKRPRRVFVNSMSDLFHNKIPTDFIDRVFDTMGGCRPSHFSGPNKTKLAYAELSAGKIWARGSTATHLVRSVRWRPHRNRQNPAPPEGTGADSFPFNRTTFGSCGRNRPGRNILGNCRRRKRPKRSAHERMLGN